MELLDYNPRFRWFVGLAVDDVFSINLDRLLGTGLACEFFNRVLYLTESQDFICDKHFSVAGALIDASAGHKSFVGKDGCGPDLLSGRNHDPDFNGESRGSATHAGTTDPEFRLFKKSECTEAKLRYMAHARSEDRNGLVVNVETTQANGCAERGVADCKIGRKIHMGAPVGRIRATALKGSGKTHVWFLPKLLDYFHVDRSVYMKYS